MIKCLIIGFILSVVVGECFADELSFRQDIDSKVKSLFESSRYSELNNLTKDYLSSESRTPSGVWLRTLVNTSLNKIMRSDHSVKHWESMKENARNWVSVDKKSPFGHMFYVNVLLSEAAEYRGTNFAKDVPTESWKPFRDRTQEAYDYLIKHKSLRETDPVWYESMINVANNQGWSKSKFNQLMEDALTKYPNFYEIYFSALIYLDPIWHGSIKELNEFAIYASEMSKKLEGRGAYARIYWYIYSTKYGRNLFKKTNIEWPLMKEGLFDVLKVYPDPWNINHFGIISCIAKDYEAVQRLMEMAGENIMISVWGSEKAVKYCKHMGESSLKQK